jgi:hypothetical protein
VVIVEVASLHFFLSFGVVFILSDSCYLFILQDLYMVVDDVVANPLEGDDL